MQKAETSHSLSCTFATLGLSNVGVPARQMVDGKPVVTTQQSGKPDHLRNCSHQGRIASITMLYACVAKIVKYSS